MEKTRLFERKKEKSKAEKAMAISQILSLMLEIISFSFIVGGMVLLTEDNLVNAEGTAPKPLVGCCMETLSGAICQTINQFDSASCKTSLLATSCDTVEPCQVGCCYDADRGFCSLNSPKEKCMKDGGNWSSNAKCDIPQCQLGCCVLGDGAAVTTSRECTNIARNLNLERNFQALDADGTCSSKAGLSKKGACVIQGGDFSGENDCNFVTKQQCSGEFYEDFLCTAKSLNTSCFPAKNTTCVEDKDQVYYLDTCGNLANVYDAGKFSNAAYWEKVIAPEDSCSPAGADCGNCDYMGGSRCYQYREGKDKKPTYGNNVCRDLNCANGRKHGESWCISDYGNTEAPGVAPIGSRWFRGICIDGEITVEPCADFNQERCVESTSDSFTESRCFVNQWRSCIAANDKESYSEVKQECDKYPNDCIMFKDIEGNENYKSLPGFLDGTQTVSNPFGDGSIDPRGRAGDVGKDANKVLLYCVPKYTPGMVFWNQNPAVKTANATAGVNSNYGGSIAETKAICGMGSFTCISHTQKKPAMTGSWKDKENPVCNIDAHDSKNRETVPLTMEALNERCRMLGPCGVYTNVAGEMGSNGDPNSTVKRTQIDKDGDTDENQPVDGYNLSDEYKGSLAEKSGLVMAGSLTSLTAIAILALVTGRATENVTDIGTQAYAAGVGETEGRISETGTYATVAGSLGGIGYMSPYFATAGITSGTLTAGSILGAGSTVTFTTATTIVPTTAGVAGSAVTLPAGTTMTVAEGSTIAVQSTTQVTGTSLASGSTPATGSTAGLGGAGAGMGYMGTLSAAAIGMTAGYYVGKLIAKWAGMSPGESEAFIGFMSGVGAAAGVGIGWALVGCAVPVFCIVVIFAAVLYALYSLFGTGEDNEYYITQYTCAPWEPPLKGDCALCNNDVRTCSDYRCRSLGQNCNYFNANGEPGYCSESLVIASATIKPWPEAITSGNKYAEIKDNGFRITGSGDGGKVEAGKPLQFGIITSVPAQCKIDSKHTKSFDEMAVDMAIDTESCPSGSGCNTNQGTYHKIGLSPSLGNLTASSTLGLGKNMENNYYIRCRNFAGQSNEAEFAVKVSVDDGPDYSPPIIVSFNPESGKYAGQNTSSKSVIVWVNEPAECKYSQGVDNRFEEMTGNMTCITNPSASFLGNLPCYATLTNLTAGENKFYFQCKDQPELEAAGKSNLRNINRNSKQYIINVCSSGLNITSLEPRNMIITGKSPISATLEAVTSGCIENGKAFCSYDFGNGAIPFLKTNSNHHSQIFTDLASGDHSIRVTCIDDAGNTASDSINISVSIHNSAPLITRIYELSNQLVVLTEENSECRFINNASVGCDNFNYDSENATVMAGAEKTHMSPFNQNKYYLIKCRDVYNNTNADCGIMIRTWSAE
jgi:hypothetical protein